MAGIHKQHSHGGFICCGCSRGGVNRNSWNRKNRSLEECFMKKTVTLVFCFVMLLLFAGCGKGDISNVKIDYGTSSVYSKEDMDAAIEVIKEQFSSFEGCELHSLSYVSDEECNKAENIEWMNDLRADDSREIFTQCIAFNSSFRSPKKGGDAWNADEEYTWTWWLARSEDGEWKLMTWGY